MEPAQPPLKTSAGLSEKIPKIFLGVAGRIGIPAIADFSSIETKPPHNMKTPSFICSHLATALVVLVSGPFGTQVLADQNWDGDNSLGNFTYVSNWYGDSVGGLGGFGFANGNLHFSYRNSAAQTTLYYDFVGWADTNDIFWDTTFDASLQWDGNGQGLNFNQRLENQSAFTQTVGVTMNLSGAKNGAAQIELNPVNGNLVLNGAIFNDHSVPYYAWGDNGKTLTLNTTLGVGGTPSSVSFNIAQNSAVVVTASQTFAGNTVISAGSLSTTGTGTLGGGSYAGAITNNGTLTIGTSANQLLSGNIGGSGPLIKDGAGTLTLSGANTSDSVEYTLPTGEGTIFVHLSVTPN